MKLCFYVLMAQAADVELLHGNSFLLQLGFELHFELATDKTVASAAHCTRHCIRVKNFSQIMLGHNSITKKMPVPRYTMHQGCFRANILLQNCIHHSELTPSAELEQEASIVIAITTAVPNKDNHSGQ